MVTATASKSVRTWSAIAMLAVLGLLVPPVAATDEKPTVIVKDVVTRILAVLDDESLSEEQARKRVEAIASEGINYYEMSKRILAGSWSQATADQKSRFIELFRQILLNNYWSRIRQYSGEHVRYVNFSIDREIYATVHTVIQGETVEIPVSYRLKYADGAWLAYDIIVESNSLIATYRASFGKVIKNHGIERLLKEMEKRAKEPPDDPIG